MGSWFYTPPQLLHPKELHKKETERRKEASKYPGASIISSGFLRPPSAIYTLNYDALT